MKLAVVSHLVPPSPSVQATVLYRLLKDLSPQDYCVITQQRIDPKRKATHLPQLSARCYNLVSLQLTRGSRFGLAKIRNCINYALAPLGLILQSRQIANVIRRENCEAILACTGDLTNLPASYQASCRTGVLFYPYLLDDYVYQWNDALIRSFARRIEPEMMREAANIIVPNEFLGEELYRRYGVGSTIIRNPCDLSVFQGIPDPQDSGDGIDQKIVYTGAVYEAHYDTFRNLIAAIERLDRPNLRLHIYTAQSPRILKGEGICGPVIFHEYQSTTAIPHIQRQADILFLPLAFHSPFPEIIRTSSPGKLGEYLASHRPILVHAPADSFVAWYVRHHECGLVVDQNDTEQLAQVLEQGLIDKNLRARVCQRALERAQVDFSISVVQAEFYKLIRRHTVSAI